MPFLRPDKNIGSVISGIHYKEVIKSHDELLDSQWALNGSRFSNFNAFMVIMSLASLALDGLSCSSVSYCLGRRNDCSGA